MDQPQVLRIACAIVGLVYRSIGDYSKPSDGFCHTCPFSDSASFRHSGDTLRYVLTAVREKLQRDGYALDAITDAETESLFPKG